MGEDTRGAVSLDETALQERSAELVRAAATGDRRAAGEYFAIHLPRLSAIARRVAGTSFDSGDLLGEALLIVLGKWADGTGPTGNVNAYITKIMRNRLLDEFKSPRSQVRYLEPTEEPMAHEDERLRLIEIAPELDLVRRALAQLRPEQREILTAIVLDGHKPRELEERFDRPATAIYSLTKRAKTNLRRAMLRLMLEEDARPECAAAARRLPEVVGDSPEETTGGRTAEHYRTCRRCRRKWAGFAALATLGVAPLLIVGDLMNAPSASAETSEEPRSQEPSDEPRSPEPTASAPPSSRVAPPTARSILSRGITVVGIAVATVGVALVALLAIAFFTRTLWFVVEPEAQIDVDATALTRTELELSLDFEVVDETWHTRALTLTLSEDVYIASVPAGWECTSAGSVVSCVTDEVNAPGGSFRLEHEPGAQATEYWIELDTLTEDGATVVGTASGRVRP